MSRHSARFSLQGWLLAVLLPVFAVLIAVFAVQVYSGMSDLVLAGFDHKLTAVSTTTAAFIDPADHARLIEPLPLGGLSRDPTDGLLWGFDTVDGTLLKIQPTDGLVVPTGIKIPKGVDNLASGIEKDALLVVDGANGHVMHFFPATGTTREAFKLEPPVTAFGTDNARGQLYYSGRYLERRDLKTGETTRLRELPEPYRDISFDAKNDVLWALDHHGRELLELDRVTGNVRRHLNLLTERPADASDTWRPLPVELVAIVFDTVTDRLIGTATSLVHINLANGNVSSTGFLPAFGQEHGPIYRRYAPAMSRAMHRNNLTFLYTQVVRGRDRITYGLDGTTGKSHSPLLSADVLPATEISGVQRLMTEGTVHTTLIRRWQEWGLIKSAFAPIFDATGRPVAIAGADVDITTIQYQTRKALVITFTSGAALLVLAGGLTLIIARQLTGPLAKIKEAALHAAAGDYARKASVTHPRELRELAETFTHATAELGSQLGELRENVLERQLARDRAALTRQLVSAPPLAEAAPAETPWGWSLIGPGAAAVVPPGGAVIVGPLSVVWLGRTTGAPVADAARRAEIALVAEALLTRHGANTTALGSALADLFVADVDAWALLAPDGAHVLVRRAELLRRWTARGGFTPVPDSEFATPLRPAPGEALVLSNAPTPAGSLVVEGVATAAALLAAWNRSATPDSARGFAVVLTSSSIA